MENPAGITDVQDNFERPLTDGEAAVVPAWLDTAWSRFKKAVPNTVARISLPETSDSHIALADVKAVLAEMVIRKLRNPDGLRTWNDDTYGQTIDAELSSGKIYVTQDEKDQFALPGAGVTNGIYVIPLSSR